MNDLMSTNTSTSVPLESHRFEHVVWTYLAATFPNPHTRKAYAKAVWDFFAWCDTQDIDFVKLRSVQVAAYREHLRHSYALTTVNLKLTALRGFFAWLAEKELIVGNPVQDVKGPRIAAKDQTGIRPIPAETISRLLQTLSDVDPLACRDRALIATFAFTWARVSAVVALRRCDFDGRQVRFLEKGCKERIIPLHHRAITFLESHLEILGDGPDNAPIFPGSTGGKHPKWRATPMTRQGATDILRRRLSQIGCATVSPHAFRVAGITNFLESGGQIDEARIMAGHKHIGTTLIYDHRLAQPSREVVERIYY